jgi:hypothetical protein
MPCWCNLPVVFSNACHVGRLRTGNLGDFFSHIPSGHLGNLPSHLRVGDGIALKIILNNINTSNQQMASWNDEASKKDVDNQTMSPLVASFMPSQASNPFFRLMESEIPASPCSESAGSESSVTNGHHVARRVSFSPGDATSFSMSSQGVSQKAVNSNAIPTLKGGVVGFSQAQQPADEKRVDVSRSSFAHEFSMKSAKNCLPRLDAKPETEAPEMPSSHNQMTILSQKNQCDSGLPNNLSPGLAVSKQLTLGTFAASTYSSPRLHSPTPRPRFSSHEGIA